jgi:hypothetical protein
MGTLITFLNSSLGLLLVGALLGALGLFTWQRQDWLFRQGYLREQVLLDRRLDVIEEINADVGRLLANATAASVTIKRRASKEQRNEAMQSYNDEQVEWFASYASHEALIDFYFGSDLSNHFHSGIVGAYEVIDKELVDYQRNPDDAHYKSVYDALQKLGTELGLWNKEALASFSGAKR